MRESSLTRFTRSVCFFPSYATRFFFLPANYYTFPFPVPFFSSSFSSSCFPFFFFYNAVSSAAPTAFDADFLDSPGLSFAPCSPNFSSWLFSLFIHASMVFLRVEKRHTSSLCPGHNRSKFIACFWNCFVIFSRGYLYAESTRE